MEARQTQPGNLGLVVTRVVNAPVEAVWNAWADPQMVRRWWGPDGWTAPVAKMDFREGGTSLVSMRSPEGHEMFNIWTYTKIEPLRRIEFLVRFSDELGNPLDPAAIGLPEGIPAAVPHVVTFRSLGESKTEVTVEETGYSSEQVVAMSKAGQEQVMDKFAAIFGTG